MKIYHILFCVLLIFSNAVALRYWEDDFPITDRTAYPYKMTREKFVRLVPEVADSLAAQRSAYPNEMTGEKLRLLILEDTEEALEIKQTHIVTSLIMPKYSLIRRPLQIMQCLFDSLLQIDSCVFTVNVRMSQCVFSGSVNFGECTFTDSVNFGKSKFSRDTGFAGSRFLSTAYFSGSSFFGAADFVRSKFSGDADFSRSRFFRDADFGRSRFSRDAHFVGSEILGQAHFEYANFYCIRSDSIEPRPGRVDFTLTRWKNLLMLDHIDTRHGVVLDFTGAKWDSVPRDSSGKQLPVLYLEGADYDKLLFRVSDDSIPRPLLAFSSSYDFPVIQRTYGKYLNLLCEEGRYADHDVLFKEFHDLETRYHRYKGGINYLDAAMTWTMGFICGYGIDPKRAFWFSWWTVLGFALIYRLPPSYKRIHPRYNTGRNRVMVPPPPLWRIGGRSESPLSQRKRIVIRDVVPWVIQQIAFFMNFFLFSVNTFCTVGYDNNYPVGGLRYICMLELVLGYITLTLFLVSMVNVLMR